MDIRDKRLIIERYKGRLIKFGDDIKTLASGTSKRQLLRYSVLSQLGDFNGSSVLDLGCGFADFYQYLISKGLEVKYTGYDINPYFVEVCRKKYPAATFEVVDFQCDDVGEPFDFIISSQAFNNKLVYDDNETVVKGILKKSYEICTKGVAIDMLSTYVDFKEDRLFYYSPEEIFKLCKSLTKRVTLRHDYPLFEFTICMYKDFAGWASINERK